MKPVGRANTSKDTNVRTFSAKKHQSGETAKRSVFSIGFNPFVGYLADNGREFANIKLDKLTCKLGLTGRYQEGSCL